MLLLPNPIFSRKVEFAKKKKATLQQIPENFGHIQRLLFTLEGAAKSHRRETLKNT